MYGYSDQTPAPSDAIFEAEVKVMEEAARNGDCIIIGRCADVVLQDKVACLRIFLQAPLDFRVKRLMATEGLDEKEALRQARQTDRARLPIISTTAKRPGARPGTTIYVLILPWARRRPRH